MKDDELLPDLINSQVELDVVEDHRDLKPDNDDDLRDVYSYRSPPPLTVRQDRFSSYAFKIEENAGGNGDGVLVSRGTEIIDAGHDRPGWPELICVLFFLALVALTIADLLGLLTVAMALKNGGG